MSRASRTAIGIVGVESARQQQPGIERLLLLGLLLKLQVPKPVFFIAFKHDIEQGFQPLAASIRAKAAVYRALFAADERGGNGSRRAPNTNG